MIRPGSDKYKAESDFEHVSIWRLLSHEEALDITNCIKYTKTPPGKSLPLIFLQCADSWNKRTVLPSTGNLINGETRWNITGRWRNQLSHTYIHVHVCLCLWQNIVSIDMKACFNHKSPPASSRNRKTWMLWTFAVQKEEMWSFQLGTICTSTFYMNSFEPNMLNMSHQVPHIWERDESLLWTWGS